MNILIFGGVGFIGTNIATLALERGHHVIACDNLMRPHVEENLAYLKKFSNFTFIWCDIRNPEDLSSLPKRIDCIINLAANPAIPRSIAEPYFDFGINVLGHMNILEFSRSRGNIPVIFASSNKVYTDKINTIKLKEKATRFEIVEPSCIHGFTENTDVNGYEGFTNSPYGAAKLSAEKYTREYWKQYGVPMVINRMSCIYGQFQKGVEDQGWVDWFLRAKREAKPLVIYGNGKQVRDLLFGRDVAELYLEEAEHIDTYNGYTFNVGGGSKDGFNISLLEIIKLIDSLFPGKPLSVSFQDWRASDQRVYISDISRVTKITHWKPHTNIQKALELMWNSY